MRVHRTLIVCVVLVLGLAVPASAGAKRADHRRLDLGAAARPETGDRLPQGVPQDPAPKVGGGQSDIGISDAAAGRFDIGDSSRDPIPGVDPKVSSSRRSPTTASA